jgi:hypothetical protein
MLLCTKKNSWQAPVKALQTAGRIMIKPLFDTTESNENPQGPDSTLYGLRLVGYDFFHACDNKHF